MSAIAASRLIAAWVNEGTSDEENYDIVDEVLSEIEDAVECNDSTGNSDDDELEPGEGNEPDDDTASDFYMSKSGNIKWYKAPVQANKRRKPFNVVTEQSGPRLPAEVSNLIDVFKLFIDNNMFDIITKRTNEEGLRVATQKHAEDAWKDFTPCEVQAYIGLLILAGVLKGNHEPLAQMWSDVWGRPILRAVANEKRFAQFLRLLRFDDRATREQRRSTDKLAAIRELTDMFAVNLRQYYVMSPFVTIDEMLSKFRGKCPFRVFMKSKPGRYGLKIWAMASQSGYCGNIQVYLGKQTVAPAKEQGQRVVKDLAQHILGAGRNITVDNFFTDLKLAEELLAYKTTVVGTMRKSKTDILMSVMPDRKREEKSSIFGFTDSATIVSFVPKKGKSVVLLSTMHSDNKVCDDDGKKPDIVLFYNSTKGGVDTLDQMCAQYSTKRKTLRWPLTLFFTFLDIAAVNTTVIWSELHPPSDSQPSSRRLDRRRHLLIELGHSLTESWMHERMTKQQVMCHSKVKDAMKRVGASDADATFARPAKNRRRGRCYICPRKREQKVEVSCSKCHNFVCGSHSQKASLCFEC